MRDIRHACCLASLILSPLMLLGCGANDTGGVLPSRFGETDAATTQRLGNVPTDVVYAAAEAVIGERYGIRRRSPAAGLIVSGAALGTANRTGYLGDVVLPATTDARRQVEVVIEPIPAGNLIRVYCQLEVQRGAEVRSAYQSGALGQSPGSTPMDAGAYRGADRSPAWRRVGRDRDEERRLAAMIAARAVRMVEPTRGSPPPSIAPPLPASETLEAADEAPPPPPAGPMDDTYDAAVDSAIEAMESGGR